MTEREDATLRGYRNHSRDWRENHYVYPVISRRSRGLSIGVNLNPDTACNFDCVYCQVDRSAKPRVREVDVDRLSAELARLIADARDGSLFEDPGFVDLPIELRQIKDIAFSGDGEPTTCRRFRESVEATAALKRGAGLSDVKIVLITDACYLTKPDVVAALAVMDANNGEVWAKLDAGTEAYFEKINRPNFPLQHVIENIVATARVRPVVIQSLFLQLGGKGPDEAEVLAFTRRLTDITEAGGTIDRVQVYTLARRPGGEPCAPGGADAASQADRRVTPLSNADVDHIVDLVQRRTGLPAEAFYGVT